MGGDTDVSDHALAPGIERVDVDSPDDLTSLKHQITDLKRRLAESEVQLDLERGRTVMARSELSEMGRKVAELQSQLERSRGGSRPLSSQRTPRPPSWTPAGSTRQPTRPTSPLTELQNLRRSLKPVRRPRIVPDDSSLKAVREKNKQLTMALLRAEAEYKRDRDRANKMIAKLQHVVDRLVSDADDFRQSAENDVVRSYDLAEAKREADEYRKLYAEEVRRRMLSEKQGARAIASTQQKAEAASARLHKVEKELITMQRKQAHLKPLVSRAWLGRK